MKNPNHSYFSLSNAIRILASDAVERARSGHPGMPLGMADVMTILAFNHLKFNPKNPKWFNRDRLVLSNGHGSMLLYAFYYLTGYKDFSLVDIKNFRQLGSKTPGHPEHEVYDAIETTTGPLGQGFAASVGMAIAAKKYQARLGAKICDYKIYCTVGDGCLMEGISYEAASLAGHLGLNNLVVLFDDNKISIDGATDLTVSEDHLKKFEALGWNVESIDGHDFEQIDAAIVRAKNSNKPFFIACRTQIAKGAPSKVGSATSHGAPLGRDEISLMKERLQVKNEDFYIEEELLSVWRQAPLRCQDLYNEWITKFEKMNYEDKAYLNEPQINADCLKEVTKANADEATRVSSGRIIEKLMATSDKMIFGSADLSTSNNMLNINTKAITKDDFSGNFIHYGVRENAMAAIMNGLALSGFLPVGSSFFVFTDYMKPSIRIGALMKAKVIYVMTHDSIGVGEDGPTHQPVEQLAAMRAMPNLLVLRPADYVETFEAWEIALTHDSGPVMLVLTRQNVPQIRQESRKNLSKFGAYEIGNSGEKVDVSIFASGSELSIALKAAKILSDANITLRVVSVPSFELFFEQDKNYIKGLLGNTKLKVAIEAASSFGWHRIIGEDGMHFGMDGFGKSAPAQVLYEHFGLTAENIARQILE